MTNEMIGLLHGQHAKDGYWKDPKKNRGGYHAEAGSAKSETIDVDVDGRERHCRFRGQERDYRCRGTRCSILQGRVDYKVDRDRILQVSFENHLFSSFICCVILETIGLRRPIKTNLDELFCFVSQNLF